MPVMTIMDISTIDSPVDYIVRTILHLVQYATEIMSKHSDCNQLASTNYQDRDDESAEARRRRIEDKFCNYHLYCPYE